MDKVDFEIFKRELQLYTEKDDKIIQIKDIRIKFTYKDEYIVIKFYINKHKHVVFQIYIGDNKIVYIPIRRGYCKNEVKTEIENIFPLLYTIQLYENNERLLVEDKLIFDKIINNENITTNLYYFEDTIKFSIYLKYEGKNVNIKNTFYYIHEYVYAKDDFDVELTTELNELCKNAIKVLDVIKNSGRNINIDERVVFMENYVRIWATYGFNDFKYDNIEEIDRFIKQNYY